MLATVVDNVLKIPILKLCVFLLIPVISFAETSVDEPPGPEKRVLVGETKVEINSVERFVSPLTQWVEGKIQKISVVKPTVYSRERDQNNEHITLRDAIKLARKQYQGTVLGANKTDIDGQVRYQIKILSSEGLVKVIDIDALKVIFLNQGMGFKSKQ